MNKKLFLFFFLLILSISVVSAVDIASDSFESNSYCGGIGFEGCWINSGVTLIFWGQTPYGTYEAWIRGSNSYVERSVDITGYSQYNLSFAYKVNSFEYNWQGIPDEMSVIIDVDGTEYTIDTFDPSDSDNQWKTASYDLSFYTGNTLTLLFQSATSDTGDEFTLDNVVITGEVATVSEVYLTMDDSYVIGSSALISIDSTETNTIHTIQIYDDIGNLFCEKYIMSPSVSHTTFSSSCDVPNSTQVDAKAYVYVTNDESINFTKYFNVISLEQNADAVDIGQIYFSPQVLQGGSTEIFAIIQNTNPLDYVQIELIYPDGGVRILTMHPTDNLNEYRAFITDTYLVGNVTFEIYAKSGDYFDVYNNLYQVIAYNLDFVDTVNQVSEILSQPPTIDVLGTYYEVGDTAKVIAQLSSQGIAINDATCFVSIYHPDDTIHIRNTVMSNVPDSDGLYTYDTVVQDHYHGGEFKNAVGVWALSVVCDYETSEENIPPYYGVYNYGVSQTGNFTNIWYDDDIESHLQSEPQNGHDFIDVDLYYNVTGNTIGSNTEAFLSWQGHSDMVGEHADVLCYCNSLGSWVESENFLSSEFTDASFNIPDCFLNATGEINGDGIIKVKINGTTDGQYLEEYFFNEDFEDDSISPFTPVILQGATGIEFGTDDAGINGTNAHIFGDYYSGTIEEGYLETTINAENYTDLILSYSRLTTGSESNELHYVSVLNNENTSEYIVEEDWETGNFNSVDSLWVESSWDTYGASVRTDSEYNGNYGLRLRKDGEISRGLDFSGSNTGATISFWAWVTDLESGDDDEAYFRVETTSSSGNYITLQTWDDDDDDETWRYYEYNLSDYPSIVLGADNEIVFGAGSDDNNDVIRIDDITITMNGIEETILESWYGNSGLATQSYNLDSSFDNSHNLTIRFYSSINYYNDYMGFDDVKVSGSVRTPYNLYTDFITMNIVQPSGVINEIRGGGEFNVKDRLAGIEETLDDISSNIGSVTSENYAVKYTMPLIYSPNDAPLLSLYLYDVRNPSNGIAGATCTSTIIGPANISGSGPVQMSEMLLTDSDGGIYYNIPYNPNGWNSGIYQIESNCEIVGEGTYYNIQGFRMEEDISSKIDEQNIMINDLNVTLSQVNIQTQNISNLTEVASIMIGGTEYWSGEEGLIAVRLAKTTGKSQSLITGATCTADILYPNQTHFVDDVSMTEFGNGIYHYNFTAPETEGVYIYSVDCSKGSKDYYAMNTFHVSPWANQLKTFDQRFTYIEDLLFEINGSMNNLNVSVSIDLTDIENDLKYLRTEMGNSNEFVDESIFLITDSIIATQNARESDNPEVQKEQMGIAYDKLEEFKVLNAEENDMTNLFIAIGILVGGTFLIFIFTRKRTSKKLQKEVKTVKTKFTPQVYKVK